MKLIKKFAREIEVEEVAICIPLEYKSACLIYELSTYTNVLPAKLDEQSTKPDAVRWLEERGVKIVRKREAVKAKFFLDCAAVLSRVAEKAGKTKVNVVELTKTGEDYLKRLKVEVKGISLDSSTLKGIGENRYGTAFGLLDALMRLNVFLPGKKVKIIGYGRVGEGCAELLRSVGCEVSVWDSSARRRIEALYGGYEVSEDLDADIIVTCTGSPKCIGEEELRAIRDGAILMNLGAEREISPAGKVVAEYGDITAYEFAGKRYYIAASGYAANLAIGNGTPMEVMDRTFAAAILALNHLKREEFNGVIPLPGYIEEAVLRELTSV
nr:adenosylhomocysteinase [Archaeoglobus neptunius]